MNTVFQDYALFPHMTVERERRLRPAVKKVGAEERAKRAEESLAMVRLEGYGDRKPGTALGRAAPAGGARARRW